MRTAKTILVFLLCFAWMACEQGTDRADVEADTALQNEMEEVVEETTPEMEIEEEAEMADETSSEPEVIETETGLRVKILKKGTGAKIERGDAVEVKYRGTLEDGSQFDAGEIEIPEIGGGVIEGWTQTLLMLSEGAEVVATIPPDLAYGSRGFPGAIPPNATLTFEMEVLKVTK